MPPLSSYEFLQCERVLHPIRGIVVAIASLRGCGGGQMPPPQCAVQGVGGTATGCTCMLPVVPVLVDGVGSAVSLRRSPTALSNR